MKRVAIQKAAEHLELARGAVGEMTLDNGFKAYEQAWSQFLTQASRLYSKLEQGAKGGGASEPWFGKKKHERKKDPLLSYIHHARDCDEHSIEHIASLSADYISAQVTPGEGFYTSFEFMIDDKGRKHYRNIRAGSPNGPVPIEAVNAKVVTLTVHDRRYGNKFEPPLMHLTRPIVDTSPKGLASLAVTYLEQLLDEASKLPQSD